MMKAIFVSLTMLGAAAATAEPFAILHNKRAVVTLHKEACVLRDVANLKHRATWEEDGKRYEGCFGVFFNQAIGFYFDDKQVAVIPVAAFVPVRGM